MFNTRIILQAKAALIVQKQGFFLLFLFFFIWTPYLPQNLSLNANDGTALPRSLILTCLSELVNKIRP